MICAHECREGGGAIRVDMSKSVAEDFRSFLSAQKATQTILHDYEHPSVIILPVIPAAANGTGANGVAMK